MPWKGYNYEDAIVLNERVVREDLLTSVHVEEYSLEVRETKRGMEELTSDIPNVSEEATKDLDENGIVRIGARIEPVRLLRKVNLILLPKKNCFVRSLVIRPVM